ncbi:MAG TPA: DUF6184 family natural product biosynthesis lipoprotein [Polyangiaceae bacterium]|nr:DUF6184 family natural product biosynthesis lipoprotein [Polyangiaceae bacterium]
MRALRISCIIAPLVGCAASADVSTTSLTSAEVKSAHVVAIDGAISEITRAQCARAQACGAVDSRGIYRGADYCDADIRRATRDDLLGHHCKYVDGARLAACVDAIGRENCANMNETEKAPEVCRSGWLCP